MAKQDPRIVSDEKLEQVAGGTIASIDVKGRDTRPAEGGIEQNGDDADRPATSEVP